eukprot:4940178-Prymnesium_polylepis.1
MLSAEPPGVARSTDVLTRRQTSHALENQAPTSDTSSFIVEHPANARRGHGRAVFDARIHAARRRQTRQHAARRDRSLWRRAALHLSIPSRTKVGARRPPREAAVQARGAAAAARVGAAVDGVRQSVPSHDAALHVRHAAAAAGRRRRRAAFGAEPGAQAAGGADERVRARAARQVAAAARTA